MIIPGGILATGTLFNGVLHFLSVAINEIIIKRRQEKEEECLLFFRLIRPFPMSACLDICRAMRYLCFKVDIPLTKTYTH